jgi:murein L,D-transpeptidase YcbB/YkuD
MNRTLLPFLLSISVIAVSCLTKDQQRQVQSSEAYHDTLPQYVIPSPDSIFIADISRQLGVSEAQRVKLFEFYRNRGYACAWFNEYGLTEQSGKVVNMVRDYIESGVFSTGQLIPGIIGLHDSVSADTFIPTGNDTLLMRADVWFTAQFLLFSETVWKGNAAQAASFEWYLPVKKFSQVEYLSRLLQEDTTSAIGSEPVFRQFHRLREKMKLYASLEKAGGWPVIRLPGDTVSEGDSAEIVMHIRRRLAVTGDFSGDTVSQTFDTSLARVVSEIRASYGMDGSMIDDRLVRELNIPVTDRLQTMTLNLERWKWIPPDPGENYLAVNIPEYMLHVFEAGREVKSMRVIVGKSVSKTVIFSGDMAEVVFSPYWIIPRSIISHEILPAVQRDVSYLANHRMEVFINSSPPKVVNPSSIDFDKYTGRTFPYSFRQKPGSDNSLGRVKFLFPNDYSIYLHDTPARSLFNKEERSFSHGCIRLSEPAWLAEYLLQNDSAWTPGKIEEAMNGVKETKVKLHNPVPVYITYFTSWVDRNGRLNFRDDVYGHDRKLAKTVFGENEGMRE